MSEFGITPNATVRKTAWAEDGGGRVRFDLDTGAAVVGQGQLAQVIEFAEGDRVRHLPLNKGAFVVILSDVPMVFKLVEEHSWTWFGVARRHGLSAEMDHARSAELVAERQARLEKRVTELKEQLGKSKDPPRM